MSWISFPRLVSTSSSCTIAQYSRKPSTVTKGSPEDETLLVATLAVVFRAVADGRNRKTLRARADRHFHRRTEDAGISCNQSDGQGAGADGRRCDARGGRRDLRLCRRTLSGSETRPAAGRSAAREISLLAVFRTRLRRAGDGAGRDQDRDESGGGGLGRCPAGIRRARRSTGEGTVDPRRTILGRGYHHRLGAELRGAAVQDGAVAAIVRPLHRSLRGAAGLPARERARGGIEGEARRSKCTDVIALLDRATQYSRAPVLESNRRGRTGSPLSRG